MAKPSDTTREVIVLKEDATAARKRWLAKGWKVESTRKIFDQKDCDTGTVRIIVSKPAKPGTVDK